MKEYTPVRRFYAYLGFIDVVIALIAFVALAIYGLVDYISFINN